MRQHAADASACRPAVEADTAAVTALRSGKVKDISPNGRVVPRSLNRVLRLAVLGRPPAISAPALPCSGPTGSPGGYTGNARPA
jgi:hypothetical protein